VNIWSAYTTYAFPIAIFHLALLIVCLLSWWAEYRYLKKEKAEYEELLKNGFAPSKYTDAEISRLTRIVTSMTRKGELLSLDSLRRRIGQRFTLYDLFVRTCLNAFVISGLLGTLYNLWKLGPSFWDELLKNQPNAGQPAIGVAFSASVFGLGSALILMLFDAFVMRRARERFIGVASTTLFDVSAQMFPSKEGAAVAEALDKFYNTSTGFLTALRSEHVDLSQKLNEQIRESSAQLNETLLDVSGKWNELAGSATRNITSLGLRLKAAVLSLTNATNKGGELLKTAIDNSDEAQKLKSLLVQLNSDATLMQKNLNTELSSFADQWRAGLIEITSTHAERLKEASQEGWKGYKDESAYWHQQIALGFKRFSDDIEKLTAQWTAGQEKVGGHIDTLISGWQSELGRNTTRMQTGMAELRAEIDKLADVTSRLSKSNDTASQQLNSLQKEILEFSRNISNGTPVGSAINTMTDAVRDFQTLLNRTDWPPPANDKVALLAKASPGINDASLPQIDPFLRHIESHVLAIKEIAKEILKAELRRNPSEGFVRRRWRKVKRIFGKDEERNDRA
jgi:Skp family chaperone for outer membrane proteins